MAGIFKYLIIALVLFVCYNEFVIMHRASAFNAINFRADKTAVVEAIGEPQHVYRCGGGEQPPSFLIYIDSLCQDTVAEVDAFPLCRIPMRCRGWNYVAFDRNNKVAVKYRLTN